MPRDSTCSRRANISTSPSKYSPERRCRRCPGQPLLSQCEHTTSGRQYLEDEANKQSKNHRPKVQKASPRCTICEGRPLRSECAHTKKGQVFLRVKQIMQDVEIEIRSMESNPFIQPSLSFPDAPLTSPGNDDSMPTNERIATPIPAGIFPSPPPVPSTPIPVPIPRNEPVGSPHSPTQGGTAVLNSSPTAVGSDIDAEKSFAEELDSSMAEHSPSPGTPSKSKSSHTTKANPKHGLIRGVMRGAYDYVIVCKHARPEPIPDSTKASKRFLETIDDLAALMGSWMFFGAQHVSASGATIHYTSPHLSRDAPDNMNLIINEFCQTISKLIHAQRTEAMALLNRLQQAEVEKEKAVAREHEMGQKVSEMETLLNRYSIMLGIETANQSTST